MHRIHFKLRVTALISARPTYFAYAKRSLTSDIVINVIHRIDRIYLIEKDTGAEHYDAR